jgi:hypothetical protein
MLTTTELAYRSAYWTLKNPVDDGVAVVMASQGRRTAVFTAALLDLRNLSGAEWPGACQTMGSTRRRTGTKTIGKSSEREAIPVVLGDACSREGQA